MIYDLGFTPRGLPPSRAELLGWLNGLPQVRLGASEARYVNVDTGVSFAFTLHGPGGLPSLRLTLPAPEVVAREAGEVIAGLAAAFGLDVDDPYPEGMGRARFEEGAWLSAFSAANARALAKAAPPPALPRERLEATWRWNRGRAAQQEWSGLVEGRACWVPSVFFLREPDAPGLARPAVSWVHGEPIALPEVDRVLLSELDGGLALVLDAADAQDLLEGLPRVDADARFEWQGEARAFGLAHALIEEDDEAERLAAAFVARARRVPCERLTVSGVIEAEALRRPA